MVLFFALLIGYPWEVLTIGTMAYLHLPVGGVVVVTRTWGSVGCPFAAGVGAGDVSTRRSMAVAVRAVRTTCSPAPRVTTPPRLMVRDLFGQRLGRGAAADRHRLPVDREAVVATARVERCRQRRRGVAGYAQLGDGGGQHHRLPRTAIMGGAGVDGGDGDGQRIAGQGRERHRRRERAFGAFRRDGGHVDVLGTAAGTDGEVGRDRVPSIGHDLQVEMVDGEGAPRGDGDRGPLGTVERGLPRGGRVGVNGGSPSREE